MFVCRSSSPSCSGVGGFHQSKRLWHGQLVSVPPPSSLQAITPNIDDHVLTGLGRHGTAGTVAVPSVQKFPPSTPRNSLSPPFSPRRMQAAICFSVDFLSSYNFMTHKSWSVIHSANSSAINSCIYKFRMCFFPPTLFAPTKQSGSFPPCT